MCNGLNRAFIYLNHVEWMVAAQARTWKRISLKTIRKSLVLICLWKLAVVWTFWNNRIDMLSVNNICIRYETDQKNLPIATFFYLFLKFVQINYIFSYIMHILYVSYNHILDHSYIMNMWTLPLTRTKLLYKKTYISTFM